MGCIKNKGSGLELFAYELYNDLGYADVRRNVLLRRKIDADTVTAQIDLTYRKHFMTRYVECKYRSGSNVSLEEVAKFCSVLELFYVPTSLGELMTNSYFDTRAKKYAQSKHLTLIDGDALNDLSESRTHGIRKLYSSLNLLRVFKEKGLSACVDYVFVRSLPIEKQIQRYMR